MPNVLSQSTCDAARALFEPVGQPAAATVSLSNSCVLLEWDLMSCAASRSMALN